MVVFGARADAEFRSDGPFVGREGRGGAAARRVVGDAGARELVADLVFERGRVGVVAAPAADDEAQLDAEAEVGDGWLGLDDDYGASTVVVAMVGPGTGRGVVRPVRPVPVPAGGLISREAEVRHGGYENVDKLCEVVSRSVDGMAGRCI